MSAEATTREFMESPFQESPEKRTMLTLSELAYLAGTHPEMIEQLLVWDIIAPSTKEPEPGFTADWLPRIRRILRLHVGLGVEMPSIPLVLDLLDRIADLEQRLSKADRSDPL